ncbi:MAG: TonB family protein [Crocinitomicaceae bacterium]|jgi:TonB family protein
MKITIVSIIIITLLVACNDDSSPKEQAQVPSSVPIEEDSVVNPVIPKEDLEPLPVEVLPPPPPIDYMPPPEVEEPEVIKEEIIEWPEDTRAEFPGGSEALDEYIRNYQEYPAISREMDITGSVIVTFRIELDGGISMVKVIKSLDNATDREAIRLTKRMPKWNPALSRGRRFKSEDTLTFNFPYKFQ